MKPVRAVHQYLPTLSSGDAISMQALFLRDVIRGMGFDSEIYVTNRDHAMSPECHLVNPHALMPDPASGIVYHHSTGSEMTGEMFRFRGRKLLIYHNITPGRFFEPFDESMSELLGEGRRFLNDRVHEFEYCAADSRYNCNELMRMGSYSPMLMPIVVDGHRFEGRPDPSVLEEMSDGRKNILFVGRLAPNKRQEDLVDLAFDLLAFRSDIRLVLVGEGYGKEPYVRFLIDRIRKYGLEARVVMPGKVSERELRAYYRSAHLFVSMSEHEGFGVPLVEASWFDVPVLAFAASAVRETLEHEENLIFTKHRWDTARRVHRLLDDTALRSHLLQLQRSNRERFTPHRLLPVYRKVLGEVFGS